MDKPSKHEFDRLLQAMRRKKTAASMGLQTENDLLYGVLWRTFYYSVVDKVAAEILANYRLPDENPAKRQKTS